MCWEWRGELGDYGGGVDRISGAVFEDKSEEDAGSIEEGCDDEHCEEGEDEGAEAEGTEELNGDGEG